jgi:heme-degrading monooxygenase HmoA
MIYQNQTLIEKGRDYLTEITFYHVDEKDLSQVAAIVTEATQILTQQVGFIAANVLLSNDQSRICTYIQWSDIQSLSVARQSIAHLWTADFEALLENESGKPRLYEVFYTDDRSDMGISVISEQYENTVFINEITTIPGSKQHRLLELVIDNNVNQSFNTPGYRSANFHRSLDGFRAVNYSLWDTEEHLIEAISEMAAQDVNLEETMELASPDFRFYTLTFAKHI